MRTIAIDFDGVIHSYTSGWTGPIPFDPPVPGAKEFIEKWCKKYNIVIYSTRVESSTGREGIKWWLKHWKFPIKKGDWGDGSIKGPGINLSEITSTKPKAVIYIDDRGFRFNGSWDQLNNILEDGVFDPWHKYESKRAT